MKRRTSEEARVFAECVRKQYSRNTHTFSSLAREHGCSVNYIRNILLGNKVVRDQPPKGESKRITIYGAAYYVYSDGRVWSCATNRFKTFPKSGYHIFYVVHKGNKCKIRVHRLVLTLFDRKPKKGEVARHLDDDPTNNDISNLAWGSVLDNSDDKVRNDLHARGERSYSAKLTDKLVLKLRKEFDSKSVNPSQYLDRFIHAHGLDIHIVNLSKALYSESWKHLPCFGLGRPSEEEKLFAPKRVKDEPTLFERKLDEDGARSVHRNFIKHGHKYKTRRAFTIAYASFLSRKRSINVSYSSIDNILVGRTFKHVHNEFIQCGKS